MKILRATHLGMCFGVRDAIALALNVSQTQPLSILGELVHNDNVAAALRARGIQTVTEAGSVTTATVMITAHGASERAIQRVRDRGLAVLEATCPLVHLAHRAVAELVRTGFHPVIVGQRDHVEVRGLTEDLAQFDVVLTDAEVDRLSERPRFGVAAQTTQPVERVRRLVARLRDRFPQSEVRFADTVCQPTKQRQAAAIELAQQCDVVVVIGGAQSNNTRELVATCGQFCAQVHHVQAVTDLCRAWFAFAGTVGITAGTSTPAPVIAAVENRLRQWAVEAEMRFAVPARAHGELLTR
jgi:4-hydroxy-3-methylbut-2-enyl diphosphate reductase